MVLCQEVSKWQNVKSIRLIWFRFARHVEVRLGQRGKPRRRAGMAGLAEGHARLQQESELRQPALAVRRLDLAVRLVRLDPGGRPAKVFPLLAAEG
jgi:hypothetical protein